MITYYENLWSDATKGTRSLYLYNSYLSSEFLVLRMYVCMHVCMYVCTRYVICMYGYIYPSSVSESVRTRAYMNKSNIHPLVDEMQEECWTLKTVGENRGEMGRSLFNDHRQDDHVAVGGFRNQRRWSSSAVGRIQTKHKNLIWSYDFTSHRRLV